MSDFDGKLVLITGSARGIGKAVAAEYARRGARIIITDILGESLAKAAHELKEAGHTVYSYECELSDDEAVQNFGAKVLEDAGVPDIIQDLQAQLTHRGPASTIIKNTFDIIHNNAYWAAHGSIFDCTSGSLAKAFDISVISYMRVIQAFLNEMMTRKSGWIINTASPIGICPPPLLAANVLPYAIVKAADISLSQSIAVALEPYNIGVTVLYPDIVKTEALDATRGTSSKESEAKMDSMFSAVGVSPEEFAPAILDEVAKGEFVASRYKPLKEMMLAFAKNGMDPRKSSMLHVFQRQSVTLCSRSRIRRAWRGDHFLNNVILIS
ncbi:hypothetical protein LCI18_003811 [Fusarium solani-melongenae]|uniref:Uncharacterized protein n=1 Tax=Fusarium solani subsp. cucurbitae TaxID=2747967 RepID=A0ACD3YVC0_FUSSC|nr:hypothetical protein LCI18_003811 [Fusarium solani-melongenae]